MFVLIFLNACLKPATRPTTDGSQDSSDNISDVDDSESPDQVTVIGNVDPFSFTPQTSSSTSVWVSSNSVTLSGYTGALQATVSGEGSPYFRINGINKGNSAFVEAGDQLLIRMKAPSTPGASYSATLEIQEFSASFVLTAPGGSPPPDNEPDTFSLSALSGQSLDIWISSDTVTVSGINTSVTASVSGDGTPYLVVNGVDSGNSTSVSNGDEIVVRMKSSASYSTSHSSMLSIGSESAIFTATTAAAVADTDPDPIVFNSQNPVNPSIRAISNGVTISGITEAVSFSVSGDGSPVLLKNGVEVSSPSNFSSGDRMQIAMAASSSNSTAQTATLSWSGGSSEFVVTTSSSGVANRRFRLSIIDDPASTISIGWESLGATAGDRKVYWDSIDHGTDLSAYANEEVAVKNVSYKGMTNSFVRLTGLSPDTAYYFVVSDTAGRSARYWFKTLPNDPTERLAIIAGGDSRNNRTPRLAANRLVKKLRPHAIFFGGDYTDTGTNAEWQEWFDDWQETIGSDGKMVGLVNTRGNHEGSNTDIESLFDAPTGVYYALNFGDTLFRLYTLNTESSIAGTQSTWLDNDLAASGNLVTWRLAQYHKPVRPHTGEKAEGSAQYSSWVPIFEARGMNLVIECDTHAVKTTHPILSSSDAGSDEGFIRNDSYGITYVGEGGWGAPLKPNNDDKDWTRGSGSFNHFQWLFIDEQKIEVRTVNVDNESTVGSLSDATRFSTPENLNLWDPGSGAVVTVNAPNDLSVALTAPTNYQSFENTGAQTLSATASDNSGIQHVEFFVDGVSVGTDNTSPYSLNHDFAVAGSYSISAKAVDNDNLERNSESRTIFVGSFTSSMSLRIAGSDDDVEENTSGTVNFTSSDLELVDDPGTSANDQVIGLRFTNLAIPQGATIESASIQFTTDEVSTGVSSLTLQIEAADNASAFTSAAFNVSSRSLVGSSVNWSPGDWNTIGEATATQKTPELKTLLQEVINRGGWAPGNAVVFSITGSGRRTAFAYDGSSGQAPLLEIEYSP